MRGFYSQCDNILLELSKKINFLFLFFTDYISKISFE
jgi:hypothetical protein